MKTNAAARLSELVGMTQDELEALCVELGEKSFRGRQIARWIYAKGVPEIDAMTDIPAGFRTALKGRACVRRSRVADQRRSRDDTIKCLVELADGERIEMVLMPTPDRLTLCVSTQVGCPAQCVFCASGAGGLVRNMTAGEIVSELLLAREVSQAELDGAPLTNLVIMGMGEPLLNYDNVLKAIRIINAPWGLGLGARHITLSTVGFPDLIDRLADEGLQINLAISLHAADDETRTRMVPVNRNIGVDALIAAARRYFEKTGREVTFEFTLIEGMNCSKKRALSLARKLEAVRCNVNVIPLNQSLLPELKAPSPPAVDEFCATLRRYGVNVHLRRRRGADIDAACGQLRRRSLERPPGEEG